MTPGSKLHFSHQQEQSIKPRLRLMQDAQSRVILSMWSKNDKYGITTVKPEGTKPEIEIAMSATGFRAVYTAFFFVCLDNGLFGLGTLRVQVSMVTGTIELGQLAERL